MVTRRVSALLVVAVVGVTPKSWAGPFEGTVPEGFTVMPTAEAFRQFGEFKLDPAIVKVAAVRPDERGWPTLFYVTDMPGSALPPGHSVRAKVAESLTKAGATVSEEVLTVGGTECGVMQAT